MDISSYVLLSHEQALQRRLDVVANNIANADTVGFRREQPVFREYVEQGSDASTQPAQAGHPSTQRPHERSQTPLPCRTGRLLLRSNDNRHRAGHLHSRIARTSLELCGKLVFPHLS